MTPSDGKEVPFLLPNTVSPSAMVTEAAYPRGGFGESPATTVTIKATVPETDGPTPTPSCTCDRELANTPVSSLHSRRRDVAT